MNINLEMKFQKPAFMAFCNEQKAKTVPIQSCDMFGKWLEGLLSVCDFWRLTCKHAKTLELSVKETEITPSEALNIACIFLCIQVVIYGMNSMHVLL